MAVSTNDSGRGAHESLGLREATMPELTESERAALSGLTLGQRIRYHAQRQREWIAEIDRQNTASAVQP
jgi:hypothetical protein